MGYYKEKEKEKYKRKQQQKKALEIVEVSEEYLRNFVTDDEFKENIFLRGIYNKKNRGANLSGYPMPGVQIARCMFTELDVSNTNMEYALLKNSFITNAKFRGTNLADACIHDINMAGTDFTETKLDNVKFAYANLNMTKFNNAVSEHLELRNVQMQGADFTGAKLKNVLVITDRPEKEIRNLFAGATVEKLEIRAS